MGVCGGKVSCKRGWTVSINGGEAIRTETPLEALRIGVELLGGDLRFRNRHGEAVADSRVASKAYAEACGEEKEFNLLGTEKKGPQDAFEWLASHGVAVAREPSNGHGGARKGAGRKAGGKNRLTEWSEEAAKAMIEICGMEGVANLKKLARDVRRRKRGAANGKKLERLMNGGR